MEGYCNRFNWAETTHDQAENAIYVQPSLNTVEAILCEGRCFHGCSCLGLGGCLLSWLRPPGDFDAEGLARFRNQVVFVGGEQVKFQD